MFAELLSIIESLQNPDLKGLLKLIFNDERLATLYRRAPAAKSIHHAYLGGLIEHVLSLCALCRTVAAHYHDVDLDLLLTAAILHDIGKIEELKFERSFGYTTPGQLLGHIVIGVQMIADKLRMLPDFPPQSPHAAGAHDPQSSRRTRVRLAQGACIPRSAPFPSPG